jgi:thiol-disulfide isomerase/thioredoxin
MPKIGNLFAKTNDPIPASPPTTMADSESPRSSFEKPEATTKVYESKAVQTEKKTAGKDEWNLPEIPASPSTVPAPAVTSPLPGQPLPDVNVVQAPSGNAWAPSPVAVQPAVSMPAPAAVPAQMPVAPPGIVRGGTPAPVFAAKTLDGQPADLSSLRGRVVLLDFWRKTCGPCLRAMPKVETLHKQFNQTQLVILGVNCDERESIARSFLQSNPHSWPNIHARSQSANPISLYGISLLPTFVVIDQVGNIQYKGSSIDAASSKVVELVSVPSILTQTPGGTVAMAPQGY